MAFTYDLTTDSGKIRRLIGDTTDGTGVLPSGENFTDDEIAFFLTEEGGNIYRAAAAAFEALAGAWASVAGSLRLGVETERQEQVAAYRKQAEVLRARHGFNAETAVSPNFGYAIGVVE